MMVARCGKRSSWVHARGMREDPPAVANMRYDENGTGISLTRALSSVRINRNAGLGRGQRPTSTGVFVSSHRLRIQFREDAKTMLQGLT